MKGHQIGHYEVLARLGGGGMGEVWKAYDPKLQRTVAIKVLHETDDAASRILAEARAASALNHPHICTIHDVGEADGQSFIVMEHVDGKPLSELIPSDGLAAESVIRYGTQITDALAHAHEHGIVHRDLKSANVVITPEAQVKLIDFGIAVPLPSMDAEAVTRTMESPVSNAPVGTLAYMAPEVLGGKEATTRSDIWSLGVLLFEMASGRLPFEGETPLDMVLAIAKETPRALPGRVSAGFRSVVQRCLQKEPGSRYSSAAVVHGVLETIQSDTTVTVAHTRGRPNRRFLPFALGALALGAVFAVDFFSDRAPEPPADRPLQLANQLLATVSPGAHQAPTLSPDGSTMAFVSDASGLPQIWVQTVTEGASPIPITDETAPALNPSWSPSNDAIGFHRPGDGIWTIGPLGTPAARRIIEEGTHPSFSWDGSQLVYERDQQIWIANADGSGQRAIEGSDVLMPTATQTGSPGFPALSPDGESVVYSRQASGPMGDLWILPVSGGKPR